MATIITKNSSTASSVPTAAQLVKGELAVNVTDKRLFTEDNSGNVVELGTNPSTLALSGGTANGVAYLNASKVLTTGSALTFDGSKLGIASSGEQLKLTSSGDFSSTGTGFLRFYDSVGAKGFVGYGGTASRFDINTGASMNLNMNAVGGTMTFQTSNSEQMRLTSTGLGIGTSSPGGRFDVQQDADTTILRFMNTRTTGNSVCSYRIYGNNGATQFQIDVDGLGSVFGAGALLGMNSNHFLAFKTNNTERARITSGGNFLINNTYTTAAKLIVAGAGTSNAAFAGVFADSAGATLLSIRNDGYIDTGTRAVSPYNNTTGSAANMYVDSAGGLYRSTSSIKYKTDVQDATHGLAEVMQLRSVTYKGKKDGDTVFGGLIAEEVHAAGLTEFVQYAPDGSPDALAYGNMVSLLTKAIQEQQVMIQQLQAEVAALKGN